MSNIINLFRSAAAIKAEKVAAFKVEEAALMRRLERAMAAHGIRSDEALEIEARIAALEEVAYAA